MQRMDTESSPASTVRKLRLSHLKSWLESNGACFDPLELVDMMPNGYGYCAFAKKTIAAGEEVVALPVRLLLTSEAALSHPFLGPILNEKIKERKAIDGLYGHNSLERIHVYLLLMFERMKGEESAVSPYIYALPGVDGEQGEAGIFAAFGSAITCPEVLLDACLKRTQLGMDTRTALKDLLKVYEQVVVPIVAALRLKYPEIQEDLQQGFTWLRLLWAHACFWSRALVVPIPCNEGLESVRKVEAMVPLIDLLNHKPGTLSELELDRSRGGRKKRKSDNGGMKEDVRRIVLRLGRLVEAGDQVYINYGCKGNAELLMYYGFTYPDNPADVYKLRLDPSGSVRPVVIYRGSCFGQVLDAARELNAKASDVKQTIVEIYGQEAGAGKDYEVDKAVIYDLSSLCVQRVWDSIGSPRSAANEERALQFLLTRVREEQASLAPTKHMTNKPNEATFLTYCKHYCEGAQSILEELVSFITFLQGVLSDLTQDTSSAKLQESKLTNPTADVSPSG